MSPVNLPLTLAHIASCADFRAANTTCPNARRTLEDISRLAKLSLARHREELAANSPAPFAVGGAA